ncbi:hypothetical protein J2S17_005612 [Cytobacillus purgationiresistens]|uniref:Uncharacterized protein n=1 Tax=Cytobacillus purgationiresistens TaxID=863449 RepID=A0ABU0AUJ6_9BACI|nr:hypothetical protein [Cytobacillus purgationiresistens]
MRRKPFLLLTALFIYTTNSNVVFADLNEVSSSFEEFLY